MPCSLFLLKTENDFHLFLFQSSNAYIHISSDASEPSHLPTTLNLHTTSCRDTSQVAFFGATDEFDG
jgi:hypothetical protein